MLGAYAPSPDGSPYTKKFPEEESPSGMLARSGTYNVRSRVIDDDGQIYAGALWILIWFEARLSAREPRSGARGYRYAVDAYKERVVRDGPKGASDIILRACCTQMAGDHHAPTLRLRRP